MRLICGIIQLDGKPASETVLTAMIDALGAQGQSPQVAFKIDGPAAMASLDFSKAKQHSHCPVSLPMGPGGVWLAADLRLDRPRELATLLGQPADADHDGLALAAASRWDRDLPDRMDGDFALAIWSTEQRRLLCARDFMGVRPLCYTYFPGRFFAFASLPRGIHRAGIIPTQADLVALGVGLVDIATRGVKTGFKDISWLKAGHSLVLTPTEMRLHRAWNPDPATVGSQCCTPTEAATTLRSLIQEAVAVRLPSSGPVASHLSGGLDSSAVTVIAARQLKGQGRQLLAFSNLASPVKGATLRDEREFVETVLEQESSIVWQSRHMSSPTETLIDPDMPFSWGALPEDHTCATVAAAGAELILSGAGGDEAATYNGSGLHAALLCQGKWRALAKDLPAWARVHERSLLQAVLQRLAIPLLPEWLINFQRILRGKPLPVDFREKTLSYLAPSFAAQVRAALPPDFDWFNRPRDRIMMLNDSYVVGRGTRWAMIGARRGVAFTYPLLDRRIVDFILSLPVERFVENGFSRQPFRSAMEGILPELIRWRTSKFSVFPDLPLHIVQASSDLLNQIEEVRRLPAAELFNLDSMASAIKALPTKTETIRAMRVATGNALPFAQTGRQAQLALQALFLLRHLDRVGYPTFAGE